MRLGLLVALALFAACYSPPQSDPACTITCTEGVADSCPGDLVCQGGYCVGPGQVCRPTFRHTAAATGFACAIDDLGGLWCWGSLTQSSLAARFDTSRHWDALDGGGGQMCGLSAGALYCWGENDDREVSGTVVGDVAQPLQIAADGISTWTAVSAGGDYTCAIGDGKVLCWGKNDGGTLGDGTTTDRAIPTPIDSTLTDWLSVSTGQTHACAVSASAGVHCWGRNYRGELGPQASGDSQSPVQVTLGGMPLLARGIAAANQSTCAITEPMGEVYCWGYNSGGQLGDKKFVDPALMETAEPVRASDLVFTRIDGAQAHYCGLVGDSLYCWGQAISGGMGTGVWDDARVFQKIIASNVTDISVGSARNDLTPGNADLDLNCAIVGEDAQCWGDNRFGQLGQGTATLATTPAAVLGGHLWKAVSAGAEHMCGIAEDNALYCWGSTERGQTTGFIYGASNPRTPCATNPTTPAEPLCDVDRPRVLSYATNPQTITTGNAFSCVLANGVASCWGNGLFGANPAKRDLTQPGGASWKTLIPTGRDGQCGTADASMSPVYCIGSVLTANGNVTRVAQLDGFTAIAMGNVGFGVFLDAASTYYILGDNTRGQLGNGSTTYQSQLAQVLPPRMYTQIATKEDSVCAITPAGVVECWGNNARGQTGSATVGFTLSPNVVTGLQNCTSIAVGEEHACALCDGTISCWGDNRYGELAQTPSPDPIFVPRTVELTGVVGDPWEELVAGNRHTCARSTTGVMYCWGFARHGALGTGAVGANLPVVVRASLAD